VVLSPAHIDHTGYLPRLINDGFRGRVYCTTGTLDLLRILLPDSGHLQEEAARHAEERVYAHRRPALPLYTEEEARACLPLIEGVEFGLDFAPAPGISARFARAGHILGSACLLLRTNTGTSAFSGAHG